jgi:hypothetical protein
VVIEEYIRAEEIGKRLDSWAMARGNLGVIDVEEARSWTGQLAVVTIKCYRCGEERKDGGEAAI